MFIKILIVIAMLAVLFTLFRSLYFLITEKESKKTVKGLTWRIGLSILLFVLIIVGIFTGVIEPHGLPMVNPQQQ
ncbi:twin transmembrane helix small protein [Aliikangiella coralliicola]|uniref:Twin transmembrane helix small protein n=1 Tax=Aliikangiella coralliicola TaxID=2592383 RepID=A0A545UH67_9GAMM|nr:twin transmembrane helix small protein [Aliikangiella coralliicola]TQV88805.1 twin transmembrane helix small protein [Aliikangiella coralliicola]